MAKVVVCDVCKKRSDKLVRAVGYIKVSRYPELKIDYCPDHKHELSHLTTPEYVKFAYELHYGVALTKGEMKIRYGNIKGCGGGR